VVGQDRCEDVVQETFVRLASYLETGNEIRELRHWLNRVVLNLAIDAIRVRRPDAPSRFSDDEPAGLDNQPEEILEEQGRVVLLLSGLSALPENERRAFVMRELEGMNAAQIAGRLATNPNNVYQLLHRARTKLRHSVHNGSDIQRGATALSARR
jgi:RNA polymerase sigma-70 factor (ECF subfamily)